MTHAHKQGENNTSVTVAAGNKLFDHLTSRSGILEENSSIPSSVVQTCAHIQVKPSRQRSWHSSIPSAVLSGLRTHHLEQTDQQLQIRGWERKRVPLADLRSIYRGCSASFHWQSPTAATGGKGSRSRRKRSSAREKGAASFTTGNTDYTTLLGTIHTEILMIKGAKHSRNIVSGEYAKYHTDARLSHCPRQHHSQEE